MALGTSTREVLLVVGMHRSGTSLVAGLLQRCGIDFGQRLMSPRPDNPLGFFEHREVVEIHEAMLAKLGTSWDDPRPLPDGWQKDPRLKPYREQLSAVVTRDFKANKLWGLKDPRLCRMLPLWSTILEDLAIEVKVLLVIRDPAVVAGSLRRRNDLKPDHATMLWLSHVLTAEKHSRNITRTLIIYNDVLEEWQTEINRVRDVLNLALYAFSENQLSRIDLFIDRNLNHQNEVTKQVTRAPQNALAGEVFQAFIDWRREGKLSLEIFDRAVDLCSYAVVAAEPINEYLQRTARAQFNASMSAERQSSIDRVRILETQLAYERQAAAAFQREAYEQWLKAQHGRAVALAEVRDTVPSVPEQSASPIIHADQAEGLHDGSAGCATAAIMGNACDLQETEASLAALAKSNGALHKHEQRSNLLIPLAATRRIAKMLFPARLIRFVTDVALNRLKRLFCRHE